MLVSGVAVASFAFDVSPLEARPFDADHDFLDPILNGFAGGLADFYEVSLPFNPAERPLDARRGRARRLRVHARRHAGDHGAPTDPAATTFAGAAWPVTLVPRARRPFAASSSSPRRSCSWRRCAPGEAGSSQALLVGAAVVRRRLSLQLSSVKPKAASWTGQQWEPYKRRTRRSASSTSGTRLRRHQVPQEPRQRSSPSRPTVASPYWRATTLDVFLDDNWREDAPFLEPARAGRDSLSTIRCFPAAATTRTGSGRKSRSRRSGFASRGASVPVLQEEGEAGSTDPESPTSAAWSETSGTRSGATPHNRRLLSSRAHGRTIRKRSCPTARS